MYHAEQESKVLQDAFAAYRYYIALKLHFDRGSSYDAIKFNFNSKAVKLSSFANRKDKWKFVSIIKTVPEEKLLHFFMAAVLKDKKMPWVGSITSNEYVQLGNKLFTKHRNMAYHFEVELNDFCFSSDIGDLKLKVQIQDGNDFSDLLNGLIGGEVSFDFFVILNRIMKNKIMEYYQKHVTNEFIWGDLQYIIVQYERLIAKDLNMNELKKVFSTKFNS